MLAGRNEVAACGSQPYGPAMISVLKHPDIRRRAVPISVITYQWMQEQNLVPRRAELIRGVIVEKIKVNETHWAHRSNP